MVMEGIYLRLVKLRKRLVRRKIKHILSRIEREKAWQEKVQGYINNDYDKIHELEERLK